MSRPDNMYKGIDTISIRSDFTGYSNHIFEDNY